jgi:ABC-type histidine transport system ATPase subunit
LTRTPRASRIQAQELLRRVYGGDQAIFRAASPRVLAANNAEAIARDSLVRVVIGDRDETYPANVEFHEHLVALAIPHEWIVLPGVDHDPNATLETLGDRHWAVYRKAFAGSGEILLDGKPIRFRSPMDARQAGIECCYQDLAVAPAMTITENLFMGREMRRPGFLGNVLRMMDKQRMLETAIARMADLKVGIRSMTQAVETLSGGQRQCVAVARAAAFAEHVVILDEPTAALGVKEGNMVLELIRRVRDKGLPRGYGFVAARCSGAR